MRTTKKREGKKTTEYLHSKPQLVNDNSTNYLIAKYLFSRQ